MSTLTFTMVKTEEDSLGIAIVDDEQVTGLLLIALIEQREAVVYISNDVLYVYTAANNSCYVSQNEQLDRFLQHEKMRVGVEVVARGRVNIKRIGVVTHISLGETLLASIYEDDTKSLLIVERYNHGRYDEYGIDVYDPDIISLIQRHSENAIKTLILAVNETLRSMEDNLAVSRILH